MSFEQAVPRVSRSSITIVPTTSLSYYLAYLTNAQFASGWQSSKPVNQGGPVNEHPARGSCNMASTRVTNIQDHMTVLRAASILGVPVSELIKLIKPKLSTVATPNTVGVQVEGSQNDNHLSNSPLWLTGYPMFRNCDSQFTVPDLDPFCGDTNSWMNFKTQEYQYSCGSEIMSSISDEAFRGLSSRNLVDNLPRDCYAIRGQSTPTCPPWGEQGQIASQSIGDLLASSLQSLPTSCAPEPWDVVFSQTQLPQLSPEMPLPNCSMGNLWIDNYSHETAFDLPQQGRHSSQTLQQGVATFSGGAHSMIIVPNEHELIFHTATSQLEEQEALNDLESSPNPLLNPLAAGHNHDLTVPGQELSVNHPNHVTPPKSWARKVRAGEDGSNSKRQQRRRPFSDLQARAETARTRKLRACIPCKFNKVRVS